MPQSGIQKTGCALLASPDLMFSSGATVPDETRFRLRYIQLPKQRKKLPSESDRKISTFGVVRLGGAGVSQQNGDVVSPVQENLFLTRWLATALKQRRFRVTWPLTSSGF
jgi:hypothetical protein